MPGVYCNVKILQIHIINSEESTICYIRSSKFNHPPKKKLNKPSLILKMAYDPIHQFFNVRKSQNEQSDVILLTNSIPKSEIHHTLLFCAGSQYS